MPVQTWTHCQLVLVECFGRKSADVGVKPPGFLQEKPLSSGNSWLVSKQMAESGYFSALRMSALCRLVQLLRVANENQIRPGVGYGQDVGQ